MQRIGEDELDRQSRRLNYVCSLLRTARRPVCPINGLMVVTPFPLIEAGSPHPQLALQNDLRVLRERLAVRCPAALLVSEMENVDGFLELVKRFGVDDARERRLGKGCEAWGDATVSRVDAVAAHAIGSFEDLIYLLFQSPETLRRRYNGKLVALLCRSRGIFAESLRSFARNAFGYDAQASPDLAHSHFLFTGCYFAATGGDEDHRAFSKAVFHKLVEQQGELEWTPKARREDNMLQTWANFFALIGMLALAAIIVGIILLFWNPTV